MVLCQQSAVKGRNINLFKYIYCQYGVLLRDFLFKLKKTRKMSQFIWRKPVFKPHLFFVNFINRFIWLICKNIWILTTISIILVLRKDFRLQKYCRRRTNFKNLIDDASFLITVFSWLWYNIFFHQPLHLKSWTYWSCSGGAPQKGLFEIE